MKGAVDPTVARKVKFFSTFLIHYLLAISSILSTLAACTAEDCLFVLISSAIAALKIKVAGSLEFTGKITIKAFS